MGYQALLFCPDEKLARVVSQVFGELDFAVDPVHEPFAAVKQFMAQRYDAIVVDCGNEQNASLLFRSARNSSFNQSSLAFALVEGQTGVAKAYRIGANLVLTKPINIDQAKGTLRIARGLLRKSSDAPANPAAPVVSSASTPTLASDTVFVSGPVPVAVATTMAAAKACPSASEAGGSECLESSTVTAAGASMAASDPSMSATADESGALEAHNRIMIDEPAAYRTANNGTAQSETADGPSRVVDLNLATNGKPAAEDPDNESSAASRSATALDAGSRITSEVVPGLAAVSSSSLVLAASADGQSRGRSMPAAATSLVRIPAGASVASAHSKNVVAPSFGGLSEGVSGGSSRNKKILIAAAVMLALAALSYFSDGKAGKFGAPSAPETANPAPDSKQAAPAPRPMGSSSNRTSGTSSAAATGEQTSTSDATSQDSLRTSGADRATSIEVQKAKDPDSNGASTRTRVKPSAVRVKRQTRADEPAPPSPTIVAAASDEYTKISGLMSSASLEVATAQLAPVRISQGVSEGLLIKRVQPKYPQAALALHAHGAVQLEATINKEGNVINPKVLRGDPVLARAAIDAVRRWRYKPYYLDGAPVEIQTQITINFRTN